MAGNSGAVIYNFPPQIIERQRWINYLHSIRGGWDLLCWYIRATDDQLVGVFVNSLMTETCYRNIKREGDSFSVIDAGGKFQDDYEMYKALGRGCISGVTDFMPYFTGILKHKPLRIAGKVIPFPGCTVPPNMIRKTETPREKREKEYRDPCVFIARPGEAVPHGIPDLRGKLQRPGLILVAYARGRRESSRYGKKWDATYWLAWWVTTSGPIRYYASDYGFLDADIPEMRPDTSCSSRNCLKGDKWSYGAWVSYVVNTAPECVGLDMHPDPDPRIAHIEALKAQGYTADYSLEYKMSEEKAKFADIKRERKKRAELWKAMAKETKPKEM
ncbi:hypothetical protein FACS189442_4690 [Spirochaetia bacterium]|nr:hypothetical protein FACS189442_4690 [Spirochaetia bacterium]